MTDYRYENPEIAQAIDSLTIIDTHEHLPSHEKRREKPTDVLREYLSHYFNRDLISAGCSRKDMETVRDAKKPLMERWRLVEPYWEAARDTGYGRSLDITARGVYGIDRIDGGSVEELNARFQKTLTEGGQFWRVLKELSRIEISVLDGGATDVDRDFFTPTANIGWLISPNSGNLREGIMGIPVRRFDDWLDGCDAWIDKVLSEGASCFKSAMAYARSIRFPRALFSEAEAEFNATLRAFHRPDWNVTEPAVGEAFENYMMHHILRAIGRRGKTLQVHTGLQEGNGNHLSNSHPLLLTELLLEYPDVDFDIFHMSYPYQHELSVLCKNFPNAYIDMCWGHIISPRAAMLALDEWLDAVPYNKISAFGGDYCMIDTVYGHQEMARRNVCRVLSRKVEAREMTADRAVTIAKALFYDNPKRIMKL